MWVAMVSMDLGGMDTVVHPAAVVDMSGWRLAGRLSFGTWGLVGVGLG